jgi:hypothetical protein
MFRLRDFVNLGAKRTDGGPTDAEHAAKLNHRISNVIKQGRNSPALPERTIETREEERFVPLYTTTSFTLKTGKRFDARIMNMSRFGVALDGDFAKVAVEDITLVGKHPVTHIRNLRPGAVFRFKTPLEEKTCNPTIIL